ncbi:hypothetical protein Q5741_18580 [Paenibacillus sp. JX-17]|uniref:Uncharacterized protein n=1 Tax=Paenibacillus lacisoli TaxID=3064525 RepID=A0ABT9CHS1_9BACL|nr:hypothetical protein [Paenibacillus sp. JX-17]MDO7908410.1 hypothetical protein [Paenibacillus sp. JX-17]
MNKVPVPGFRTGALWKKILASVFYVGVILTVIILILLKDNKISGKDNLVISLQGVLFLLFLVIIPYLFIFDIMGVRARTPLLRSSKPLRIIIGSVIAVILLVVGLGITTMFIDKLHSQEYLAEQKEIRIKKERIAALEKEKQAEAEKVRRQREVEAKQATDREIEKNAKETTAAEALKRKQDEQQKLLAIEKQKEEEKAKKEEEAEALAAKTNLEEETAAEEMKRAEQKLLEEQNKKIEEEQRIKKAKEKVLAESAENYKEGLEIYNLGGSVESIDYFKKVIPEDPNYINALGYIKAAERDEYSSGLEPYDYLVLKKNADKYKGIRTYFQGKITSIQEFKNKTFLILSTKQEEFGNWTNDVAVTYDGSMDAVEGDVITVTGEIEGKYSSNVQAILITLGINKINFNYTQGTNTELMPYFHAKYYNVNN